MTSDFNWEFRGTDMGLLVFMSTIHYSALNPWFPKLVVLQHCAIFKNYLGSGWYRDGREQYNLLMFLLHCLTDAPEAGTPELLRMAMICLDDENRIALQSLLHFLNSLASRSSINQVHIALFITGFYLTCLHYHQKKEVQCLLSKAHNHSGLMRILTHN